MYRDKIMLNNYEYIVDLFDSDEDNFKYYDNFVFIRKFNYINNIAQDTDIYIIEKNIFDLYINNIQNLIFPVPNTKNSGFSNSIYDFSDIFDKYSYYKFYNKNGEETKLKCNKVRIYHPNTKSILKGIVYIHNYINSIHFHYLCKDISSLPTYSDNEFEINHNKYSEYIEVYIPNINDLFCDDSDIYYKEDINILISDQNENFMKSKKSIINEDELYKFNLFIQPYRIVKEINKDDINEIINVKQFLKLRNSIENNYLTFSLNVTVYPYSYIDSFNNKYIYDDNLLSNTIVFSKRNDFKLLSNVEFNEDNQLYINNFFIYPNKEYYINNYNEDAFKIAYKNLNNIKEDYDISFNIKLYTSLNMNHYIYDDTITININDLKNITKIKISNIFDDWVQVPDMLYILVKFKDEYIGVEFTSNRIVLNNEKIKYLIKNNEYIAINSLIKSNENMKEIKLSNDNVNFIYNINCILNKNTNDKNIINKSSTQKIIYKPIFYKTQDLQNIKLIKGISQNIGICLVDYMTKVESFKLIIDNEEYIESGRNDIFVIFKINSNNIQTVSGKYIITNQSGDYISSGNYILE